VVEMRKTARVLGEGVGRGVHTPRETGGKPKRFKGEISGGRVSFLINLGEKVKG